MPYCTVCRIETDYEYDIALANGGYLHYSCIILLQMRKHEIEAALQKQKPQLILSLFVRDEVPEENVLSAADTKDLHLKLTKVNTLLTSLYDQLPSWPPDWEERKRWLLRERGSVCSYCKKEGDVYLVHDIPVFEGGTNELDTLALTCAACYRGTYREGDIFGDFTRKASQSEFSEQVAQIQSAIDNHQRIQFGYKKPSAKRWMTRVVVPDRLLNIPNSRESGETLCVEGFCELRQATRVFALERMQALAVIED